MPLFTPLLRLASEEEGATLAEYGLLVSLIGLLCVGAVTLMGSSTQKMLQSAANGFMN